MSVLSRRVVYESPWLDVVEKEVELGPPRGRETFWSARTKYDYSAVVAVTDDGRLPLVRQFRPAVEESLLELPSGGVERGEAPEAAIRRELLEETGCQADELVSLGSLVVDSGRLETRQWGFFAPGVRVVTAAPDAEEPLELLFVQAADLGGLIARGEIAMATHLAVIAVAAARGLIAL